MIKVKPLQSFHLLRVEDVSGTSGTGVVAMGTILPSGKCVLEWTSFHTSVAIYNNIQDVEIIHGHNGKTKVILTGSKRKKNE